MEEKERVQLALQAALDTKAEDIRLYDMENRSTITDYVLLCSGRSQGHVRGVAEKIDEAMRNAGYRHSAMEGEREGSWVLIDFDILLVHIFHPETRSYYDLESLLQGYPCEMVDSGDSPKQTEADQPASMA